MNPTALIVSLTFGVWGVSGLAMIAEFFKEIGATLAGYRDDYSGANGYGIFFLVATAALLLAKIVGVF